MSISKILRILRQKIIKKKPLLQYCFQCFNSEKVLQEHKETCLKINGIQSVKLKIGSIKFKNYFKQLAMLFKIYADFQSLLKGVQSNDKNDNTSYTKIYQRHIPCSFTYEFLCVNGKFDKSVVLHRGKNAINKFIEAILQEYDNCKKLIRKYFNKNLVMSAEHQERFQLNNKCWICHKLLM